MNRDHKKKGAGRRLYSGATNENKSLFSRLLIAQSGSRCSHQSYPTSHPIKTSPNLEDIRTPRPLHDAYLFILPGLRRTVEILVRHGLAVKRPSPYPRHTIAFGVQPQMLGPISSATSRGILRTPSCSSVSRLASTVAGLGTLILSILCCAR